MSTPWQLYNEVSQNNTRNYSVYRCVDPVALKTEQPWYSYSNVCPCDPNLSNKTGRGFTACPLGINQEAPMWSLPMYQTASQVPNSSQTIGSMFGSGNQFVPPQLQPRQLIRIGEEWRSAN
jgi:hypothetical protein